LGELIEVCDERNTFGLKKFYGLNIQKEFMPTVANTEGLDESKYKVVRKHRFVFSGMQTGRDVCIRIGMYINTPPIIVSPAYTTFEITRKDLVLPEYLFISFLSKEKDRYGAFCSDGSIRSNLDWERFCDFDITLPPLAVQRKYVAVYLAMQDNLAAYQSKVDDLKTVCDGYMDKLKKTATIAQLKEYIEPCDERNVNGEIGIDAVMGISTEKTFIETKANMIGVKPNSYKVVPKDTFAYVPDTSRRGDKMAIALNREDKLLLVSSIYTTFRSKDTQKLLPEYLFMFFNRPEFDRYARFHSWGSAREVFTMDDMNEVKIPIPDISVQREIVNIHKCYLERQRIAEELKAQINRMCPVLIKGSLETENG